ncbi:MAG: sulfurtransferase TusA family protein [Emcibacter sp.]|nr:sulfurtransferase TusA family protein [Emcibacter sp.]
MKQGLFSEKQDATLDVTGHKCPVPILRVRRQLERMAKGAILKITATDAMTRVDFPHFCHEGRHELLEMTEENGIYSFLIRKSGEGDA